MKAFVDNKINLCLMILLFHWVERGENASNQQFPFPTQCPSYFKEKLVILSMRAPELSQ